MEKDRSRDTQYMRGIINNKANSHLYQPFDSEGVPLDGYDSVERLRKELRGELSSDGGYTESGGGSITTPISLPDTNTSRTYDLDGLGNWVESDYVPVGGTQNTDARQHNKLNEILNRKIDDDAKVLFVYDKNGNLTNDGTLSYSYDALNRLIQVNRVSDGQPIGYYSYDTLNRRLSKIITNGGSTGSIPNGTTQFLYLQWQVVEEGNESYYEYPTKQYVWGQYIDECIQMKTLTTTGSQSLPAGDYYPLQDLLYRTTALTNSSGNIVEAYDYDAYGNTLIFKAAGTGGNWWADNAVQANYGACDVLYCGYRYDPEAKQYQVRNREYIPTLGRWLQRDPIGFKGGDWNLYGYVGEKPIKIIDSFGLYLPYTASAPAPDIIGEYDILADAESAFETAVSAGLSVTITMVGAVFALVALDASPATAGPKSDDYHPTPVPKDCPPPPCDEDEYSGLTALIHSMCDGGTTCKGENIPLEVLQTNRWILQKCLEAREYRDQRCANRDPKPDKHEEARNNTKNAIKICDDKINAMRT